MSEAGDTKRRLHWDPTISAGNVMTAATLLIGIIFWGARLEGRVDRAEDRQGRFEVLTTAQRAEDKASEAAAFAELRQSLRRIEDILLRQAPPRP